MSWATAARFGAQGSQLSQLISLSGSFTASGLVVAAAWRSSPVAHAWTFPARLPDGYLPPRLDTVPIRVSGKVGRQLSSGDCVVEYPVSQHLVSVWSPFYPKNLAITALKNVVLQTLLFMESYMERVKQAEEAEGDSDGFVEELPPVPWRDVPRRGLSALWAFMREVATATVRRILEHRAAARLAPRLAWKLLKDVKESSLRKARRLTRPERVLRGWVSTFRAMTLSYTADFIVSSAIDSCRSVCAELREAQCRAEADAASVRLALVGEGPLPDAATVHRAAALKAPLVRQRLPASVAEACRSGHLPKRMLANALRCSVCLFASSAAAGLVAAVWPGLPSVLAYNAADLAVSALVPRPQRPRRAVVRPLSAVLAQLPALFDERKVAAVERGVTVIDALPARFQDVMALYVSKNPLACLAGVAQFRSLRCLGAADCGLAALRDLDALAPLAGTLQAAAFEGCPLSGLPHYREHVLQRLPALQQLDGRTVTGEERAAAAESLRREAVVLALMASSACLALKLGRAAALMRVHTELQRLLLGGRGRAALHEGALPAAATLDAVRLLQLWDLRGPPAPQEREGLDAQLRKEVSAVYHGAAGTRVPLSWDGAFAQAMLRQQQELAQLVADFEATQAQSEAALARLARADPHGRLAGLQAAADQSEQQRRCEREALIRELRDSVCDLAGAFQEDAQGQARDQAAISQLAAAAAEAELAGAQRMRDHLAKRVAALTALRMRDATCAALASRAAQRRALQRLCAGVAAQRSRAARKAAAAAHAGLRLGWTQRTAAGRIKAREAAQASCLRKHALLCWGTRAWQFYALDCRATAARKAAADALLLGRRCGVARGMAPAAGRGRQASHAGGRAATLARVHRTSPEDGRQASCRLSTGAAPRARVRRWMAAWRLAALQQARDSAQLLGTEAAARLSDAQEERAALDGALQAAAARRVEMEIQADALQRRLASAAAACQEAQRAAAAKKAAEGAAATAAHIRELQARLSTVSASAIAARQRCVELEAVSRERSALVAKLRRSLRPPRPDTVWLTCCGQ
ncbi:hypothetical protein WJX81_006672 [Elliptochloris bilobata]|uniref:U2A'/phosphoprotein 32 family A C-terminal domain-containing protein n=1 Tax=Elliptochloris bilobata TaxID=381761 RepID=A0AAW1SDE5_9CHLO